MNSALKPEPANAGSEKCVTVTAPEVKVNGLPPLGKLEPVKPPSKVPEVLNPSYT